MSINCQDNYKRFVSLCVDNIRRPGVSEFLNWLADTDFFTAPASSKFHGACEGGLCEHSLAVYSRMMELLNFYIPNPTSSQKESAALVSLMHDVCKINTYKASKRNVKNLETNMWETVPCFVYDERLPFGAHGAKSMYLIQSFIQLKPDEAAAILHHMGAWDKSQYNNCGVVYEWNRLAWLLHVADEAATYLDKA